MGPTDLSPNLNSNQDSRRSGINQLSDAAGEQVANNQEYVKFMRYTQAIN